MFHRTFPLFLPLILQGCHVIVDDIGWADEAIFEDDELAQAVRHATAKGVAYFSAAGNDGFSHSFLFSFAFSSF